MVTTKLNLSMTEPSVRQIYAKQGDTGRVLDISLDQTPEDGTLRILRPDGTEVTSEAVTGGEISESGETVTFDSLTEADVTELTVGIEPVQDLNGYDAPWVGGAGKNLFENTATSATTSGITFTVNADGSVTASGTATADSKFAITIDTSKLYGDYYFVGLYGQTETTANAYIWDNTTNARCKQWDGTTNSTNSFNGTFKQVKIVQGHVVGMTLRVMNGKTVSGLVFRPMICKSTETNPTWQPYSNICPITGHDEVTVTRTGKNLITGFPSITQFGVTFTANADGSVTANGTATGGTAICLISASRPYVTSLFGKEVILSGCPSGGSMTTYRLQWWGYTLDSGGVGITIHDFGNGTTPFIPTETSGNIAICISNGTTVNNLTFRPMIRLASAEDDTYEPYRSNTYTTSLGQTVYGGTLDMVSGKLTVTHAIEDLGALSWTKDSGSVRFYVSLSLAKKPSTNDSVFNGISSVFVTTSLNYFGANKNEDGLMALSTGGSLSVRVLSLMSGDATAFATAMSGQSVVYELATPQTYTLTAQQIKTLVGTNNVWASSGDIISIKFAYGGLLSELPSEATEIVGKCYCDVEQNGVSSMPFTLNVKKNERES